MLLPQNSSKLAINRWIKSLIIINLPICQHGTNSWTNLWQDEKGSQILSPDHHEHENSQISLNLLTCSANRQKALNQGAKEFLYYRSQALSPAQRTNQKRPALERGGCSLCFQLLEEQFDGCVGKQVLQARTEKLWGFHWSSLFDKSEGYWSDWKSP